MTGIATSIGFDKIAYGLLAAGIIAAPALIDKTSIAAKAEGAVRTGETRIAEGRVGQGVHVPVLQSDDPSCRVVVTRERGMDGSILIRRVSRCG